MMTPIEKASAALIEIILMNGMAASLLPLDPLLAEVAAAGLGEAELVGLLLVVVRSVVVEELEELEDATAWAGAPVLLAWGHSLASITEPKVRARDMLENAYLGVTSRIRASCYSCAGQRR